jgi:hypothetical protein
MIYIAITIALPVFLLNAADDLTLLTNPRDNTPIAGFPRSSKQIGPLSNPQLNALLKDLGLAVRGGRPAKEQRFR